jgi:hypothetical protein
VSIKTIGSYFPHLFYLGGKLNKSNHFFLAKNMKASSKRMASECRKNKTEPGKPSGSNNRSLPLGANLAPRVEFGPQV